MYQEMSSKGPYVKGLFPRVALFGILRAKAEWEIFRLLRVYPPGRIMDTPSYSLLLPGHEVNGFALSRKQSSPSPQVQSNSQQTKD